MPNTTSTVDRPHELGELADQLQKDLVSDRRAPDIRVRPKSYLEWVGVWLTWAVLGLIALFLVGLLIYLGVAMPTIADFGSPATEASLVPYQKASDLVFQRATTLLDQVVIKILVPLLTLLLGYVFGSRAAQGVASEGNG
jgi:hypothetical protein